jgi:hypothetical protein
LISIKVEIRELPPPAPSAEPDEPVCVARRTTVPRGKLPIRTSESASLSMSPELVYVWRSVECAD